MPRLTGRRCACRTRAACAVSFLSFVPQFMSASAGFVFGQFVLLRMIVVFLNTMSDFLLIYFSTPLLGLWPASRRLRLAQQAVSSTCLVGFWICLAASGSNRDVEPESAGS